MILDGYQIGEELGRASHHVLYRGVRRADGASVLLRLVRGQDPTPRDLAMLRHELAIAAELDLGCVVRPIDLLPRGRSPALVLQDPGGRPLERFMARTPRDLGTTLRIAIGLANGIESIHRRHVIHKDIAPHNILVSDDARSVWLLGFGLATRLVQEPQRLERPDALEGTLAYCSPERTGRMNRSLDHRTDLYSLGVVLYEALAGVLPFRAADPLELVYSHVARRPTPVRDRAPGVPEVVSGIVMKLLAKNPEDRYQRAAGLSADLSRCLQEWESTGRISPFPLGQQDHVGELRVPQRLHGRDLPLAALTDAWARTRQCGAELVLVTGPSGVGKSALVHEIHKAIAQSGGYFVGGKFDQLNRSLPYAALASALRELVRTLGTERAEVLARWKERLRHAVGPRVGLLTVLIPELALLLGAHPSADSALHAEADGRFDLVLQSFLRVFMDAERPLVLFLDDLQWADPASLKLLKALLIAPDNHHLLVVGTYRDNEVDIDHPVATTLGEIREHATVSEIALGPLDLGDVSQLVSDALGGAVDAEQLGQVVLARTEGNPFLVVQFLTALSRSGALWFDAEAGAWRWDGAAIRERTAAEGAGTFLVERIRDLKKETQHVLSLAACVGHRFDIRTLSVIREASAEGTAGELSEALREGIVSPLDPEYRFLESGASDGSASGASPQPFHVVYEFAHDRVQQAAYSLIEEDRRPALHLRIGRLLLANSGGSPTEELFEVVRHLNIGGPLITEPAERLSLAHLNLAAGRKARLSAAHETAARLLAAGIALLPPGAWRDGYELSFALHVERAECELSAGRFDAVLPLVDVLASHARTPLERARVAGLRMVLCSARGDAAGAMALGIEGLRALGLDLLDSEEARRAALDAAIAEVQLSLGGRKVAELLEAPALTDPNKRAALDFLTNLAAPAYQSAPQLFSLIVVNQVNIALKHGNSDGSPYAYMLYAFMLATERRRYAEAYEYGKLALDLNEQLKRLDVSCKLNFLFAVFAHFLLPLRAVLPYFERAYQAGIEARDLVYLSYTCSQRLIDRLGAGDPLSAVREETESYLALMERTKVASSKAAQTIVRQVIANLEGRTARGTLSDPSFDEGAFVAAIEGASLVFPTRWYYTAKLQLAVLYGDEEAALDALARVEDKGAGDAGFYFATEIPYYACLALLSSSRAEGERGSRFVPAAAHLEKLSSWAASCPGNYLQKLLLAQAEAARAEGDDGRAMDLYDRAIGAAEAHDNPRDLALSNERCAKLHLARGRVKVARVYLNDAVRAYARWGASAKVAQLVEGHPELVDADMARQAATGARPGNTSLSADRLDMTAVLGALQALSGELILERLMARFMTIVVQSAGAARGILLLVRDGELNVEATIAADPDAIAVGLSAPLAERSDLAVAVVRYVARFREPIVLGDAASEPRFAGDPYIAAYRPRSIACVPMAHQGLLKGALYLENAEVSGAFTPERMELIGLLSSQAATAVENALLYARVKRMSDELLRANATLEEAVTRRTEELSAANEQLKHELSERARAEAARAALQEEVVRAQAARLAELSTPLIPITDRIVVVPLIGAVDSERARQLLQVALEGVHARSAAVVIVDVTGVTVVDTGVAGALITTASALRLLGAETVVTGIGGAMAQALIHLGLDLEAMVTKGTLQSGIAYAVARTSRRSPGVGSPGRQGA